MPLQLRVAACVLLSASLSCAAPFRAGAPVDVERHWNGTVYRQDGRPVDVASLLSGLEEVEASRDDATAARSRIMAGLVLAIAGGAASGYGLGNALNGTCNRGCAAVGLSGVAVAAVGIVVDHAGQSRLRRAVGAYNGGPRAASAPALVPWAAAVPDARGRCVEAGLALRF